MTWTDMIHAFSSHLGALRKARGLSQGAMATLMGISRSYLSVLEGGRDNLRSNTVAAIAAAARVNWRDLIRGSLLELGYACQCHDSDDPTGARDTPAKAFGRGVATFAKDQALSLHDLAAMLGYDDPTYVGPILRGERNLSFRQMEEYARALGRDLAELLGVHPDGGVGCHCRHRRCS